MIAARILMLAGAALVLLAAVGVARFRDVLARMHALEGVDAGPGAGPGGRGHRPRPPQRRQLRGARRAAPGPHLAGGRQPDRPVDLSRRRDPPPARRHRRAGQPAPAHRAGSPSGGRPDPSRSG
ncbi:monovalent cation/H(+) antiporter subunit G [Aquihabitans sp. G128]|nr:monovalent cation/H(+) antiporter subunit G [Aquihabitans sp. G128]